MHLWLNKSITRASKLYSPTVHLSNVPKGTTAEEWKKEITEFKFNKLIVLDKVPKPSKKVSGKKSGDAE
jgi:hypothetical protein